MYNAFNRENLYHNYMSGYVFYLNEINTFIYSHIIILLLILDLNMAFNIT